MNIKFIDFETLINDTIFFKLDADFKKFEVSSEKLKRKFLIYRLCDEILSIIKNCNGSKIVFYFNNNSEYKLNFTNKNYTENVFRKISTFLKLNVYKNKINFKDLENLILSNSGEAKEVRINLDNILNKNTKNVSLESLYKYLAKNQIYKIKDILDNNNVKLGIFIT